MLTVVDMVVFHVHNYPQGNQLNIVPSFVDMLFDCTDNSVLRLYIVHYTSKKGEDASLPGPVEGRVTFRDAAD